LTHARFTRCYSKSWDAAKKALLVDVKAFLDQLIAFKEAVDTYQVRVRGGYDRAAHRALL
jgi:hypothetical protein